MKGGPDIAIMLAKKAHGGEKDDESDDGGMYKSMADDMISAIKDGDADLLSEILRNLAAGKE